MSKILSKHFTLKLNRHWQPIEVCTIHDAIVAMCRLATESNKNSRPYFALDIDFPNLNMPPLSWDDWVKLPVRPQDNYIQAALQQVRVPSVIIANNYDKDAPEKNVKFSKKAVWKRDNNTCQWSGELVDEETGDVDHIVARDLGGKTIFENVVLSSKKINRLKKNLTLEEFLKKYPQYKLRRKPFRPKAKRVEIINTYGIQDWDLFLKK
jgi:5-methylcytosine-specific restriction endonuclease McrA